MENDTPAAPAPASEAPASEAPNTNTNQGEVNGDGNTTNQSNNSQVSPKAEIPSDQIEAWNKFMEANGGFAKAFQKVKDTISNPQPKAEAQGVSVPNEAVTPEQTAQPVQAPQPPTKAEGFISPTEIAALQYNRMMAEAYPELDAKYMAEGQYLKEAAAMGIPAVDGQGNFNDKAIRQFLELKKAAIPPKPASAPITTTPTADFTSIEGEMDSREKAMKVMSQGENHPQYKAAVEFMRNSIFPGKPQAKAK